MPSAAWLWVVLAGGPSPGASDVVPAPTWDGHDHPHLPEPPLGAPPDPSLAGPDLQTPWPCGQVETCTQGHNGGSHTGTSAWAWDFAQQDGEEIWAASAGVVSHLRMNMTNGGCDPAFSSDANYITVDHGDGTSIVYVHMQPNSSPLSVGDTVEVGDLVARVGETGYACGAHLHMQVQETCGAYYCQSLSGNFADYGDPMAVMQYEGTNCPECARVLDGRQTVVDDEDAGCLVRQTTAWWSSYEGHDDHHFYTRAIDEASDESIARWRFGVSVPGDYQVEVFVPEADATTTNAQYQVHHAGGTDQIVVDQSTDKGWQTLGTFEFVGDDGEGIELGDATGEAIGLDRRIAYDAIRLTFEPSAVDTGDSGGTGSEETGLPPDPDGGGDGPGPTATGGGSGGGGGQDAGGDGLPGGTVDGGSDDGYALPPGFGEADSGEGCGCRSSRERTGGGGLLLLWVLLGRRRRPSAACRGS